MITKVVDNTSAVGLTGLASMLLLEQISVVISIMVGIVTFGYMATKWYNEHKKLNED